jgi:hypothetical protein
MEKVWTSKNNIFLYIIKNRAMENMGGKIQFIISLNKNCYLFSILLYYILYFHTFLLSDAQP